MCMPAEKNIIRRASGLLSNIAAPFANHRASFLLDTSEPSEDSDEMTKWSARSKRAQSMSFPSQVLVETSREVHTSSVQSSPRKDIRIITSQNALMAISKSKAHAQSLLKPHSYHYQKVSSSANSSSQGYRIASQRLSSSSRSMDQIIMGDDFKELVQSSDFQAAFACPLNLSPILDEPNSPESESDVTYLFSPRQRGKSLQPVSSRMERSIETTSSIGYNLQSPQEQNQSSHWKAPEQKRLSKEDYSTWIRFENPIDLLSPTASSEITSPSVFSNYSFDDQSEPQEQQPPQSYSMTREETQSYLGVSPDESTFCMHSHSDLGSSSQNFGALSSSGLFLPPSSGNASSASLMIPKAENHHSANHQSLRKKISQSLKDAFGKPAHDA
ncbi:hypothetical protein PCANC_03962 [Puccinia coronata f. sp. avenae]|uniref:Uncharacterized protein n=1 Tax=Puccinia coronata f. sp. avenae TaxID=200324 RepID=A0A2N5T7W8_9BASI|nr:hypothetical protein PCANC_03962 [Puccinia coronata f. sp. avenae]